MTSAGKITTGILCILAGFCLCPIGAVQIMAEGPHGPNGEITGAPGGPARLLLCFLGFVTLLVLGILQLVRGFQSRSSLPKQ